MVPQQTYRTVRLAPIIVVADAFTRVFALFDSTTASDMTPDSSSSASAPHSQEIPTEHAFAYERAARVRAEAQVFGRDQVLSVASHDLRGPLNAIHTWAHVLE